MAHPEFDDKDQLICNDRKAARDTIDGPRVGDFIKYPDGTYKRFTHDWGDSIQTTVYGGNGYGFYLGKQGYVSYSGSLNPSIDKARLRQTEETRLGGFWFFHHDYPQAHNGVEFDIPCRVFELV